MVSVSFLQKDYISVQMAAHSPGGSGGGGDDGSDGGDVVWCHMHNN